MPDYDGLRSLAADRGIRPIEDAAEAVGSEYRGQRAGSFGTTGVFSFHGSKTLPQARVGFSPLRDEALFRKFFTRDHGREPGDRYFQNTAVGFKYKMSAPAGRARFGPIGAGGGTIARKGEIFAWYASRLHGVEGIQLNVEPAEPATVTGW